MGGVTRPTWQGEWVGVLLKCRAWDLGSVFGRREPSGVSEQQWRMGLWCEESHVGQPRGGPMETASQQGGQVEAEPGWCLPAALLPSARFSSHSEVTLSVPVAQASREHVASRGPTRLQDSPTSGQRC